MSQPYVAWKKWREDAFGLCDPASAIYYAKELQRSGISSVRGLMVGELGFGNGTFAGWVQQNGGHWVGREAIPELERRAVAAGFKAIPAGVEFSGVCGQGTLDVMAAWDVLEHLQLEQIRAFLSEVREVLKPGGRLIARLPSGDSPFAHAIHHGDLTHRTTLGSSAVHQLAHEAGLEAAQVRSPVLPVEGFDLLSAVRRLLVIFVQSIVFKVIRTVLMSNRGAIVTPNMLVVLRKGDESVPESVPPVAIP